MSNISLDELEKTLAEHGISVKTIEKIYPKLYEPVMNLSLTGVPARVYFYWKKSGLVDGFNQNTGDKGWVKINLIEYLWIKIIVYLREYGVPFEKIKETKEIMFTNIFDLINGQKEEYLEFLRVNRKLSKKKLQTFEKVLTIAKSEMEKSPDEFKIYHTLLGYLILELLLKNDKGYITLIKKDDSINIGYFSIKSINDFGTFVQPFFDEPCLFIPIRSIIKNFLEDDKTEQVVETISLLNFKEMKVIEAIRQKDFKKIIIEPGTDKKPMTIDVEKDGDILDKKAKEVKQILGLNEYSEVTIKYRNDKHLYFKNKTRL